MEKIRSMLSGRVWLILLAAVTVVHCSAPPSENESSRISGVGGRSDARDFSGCDCPVTLDDGLPSMDLNCYCSKYACPMSREAALDPSSSRYVGFYQCDPEVGAPPMATWADGWNSVTFYFEANRLIGGRLSREVREPDCEANEFTFGVYEKYKGNLCDFCLLSRVGEQAPEGECLDEDIVDEPSVGGMGGIVW